MSVFMYAEDRWDPEEPRIVETCGPLRIYDDDPQEWRSRPVGFVTPAASKPEVEPLTWEGDNA